MMYVEISVPGRPGEQRRRRDVARVSGWCILRTSPGQTLNLAASLAQAGIEAWTPMRTFKRPKPGRCSLIDGKKPTVEIDAPILPTFVFVRAPSADAAAAVERDPASPHPAFSIMRYQGEAPFVAEGEVAGLQAEEQREAELLEQLRAAESRDERRRIKAAAAATERERRRALLAEPRHFAPGTAVTLPDEPLFAGMTGLVQGGDGKVAHVSFGGGRAWKIEAWRLLGDRVDAPRSQSGAVK